VEWTVGDDDDVYFFNDGNNHGVVCQAKLAFERLPIAKVYHPFICGPESQTVRELMERTGVKIIVPPHSVDKDEIVVSGEKEGVSEAKRFILTIYEEKVITSSKLVMFLCNFYAASPYYICRCIRWGSRSPWKGQFCGERAAQYIVQGYCDKLWKNVQTSRDSIWDLDSVGPKEACVRWGAHWRYLSNTAEPSMCGGSEACCQVTL